MIPLNGDLFMGLFGNNIGERNFQPTANGTDRRMGPTGEWNQGLMGPTRNGAD